MHDRTVITPQLRLPEIELWLVLIASCIAYVLSEGARFGDATTYAGQLLSGLVIEPGHLVWRPLAYLVGRAFGTLESYSDALWTLQGLCLAASLTGLLAIYFLCRTVAAEGVALFVAAFTAVSNSYWVYAFSGCSYTCGILLQTLSLHYAIRRRDPARPWSDAVAAGGFGGLAACAWAINAVAAPATLLALLVTAPAGATRLRGIATRAAAFALGYATTFLVPLLLGYAAAPRWRVPGAAAAGQSFSQWLASSRHGVPVHFGPAQVARAVVGWAQSVVSLSDFPYRLRLWHFGEERFPLSWWSLALPVFYAGVVLLGIVLARSRGQLDRRTRSLVYVAVFALGLNLAFGVLWQGTDLERYMPSWPFQVLLLAIGLNALWQRLDRAPFTFLASAILVALVIVNSHGTFEPLLDAGSYRDQWVTAIRRHASAGDLVLVLGQRKSMIVPPHDGNFPKVENVSDEIEKGGEQWRSTMIREIRRTQSRGGRVFLADSLFWTDSAPRDGWSFREYPVPTPHDLREAFLPFKSDRVAFTVGRERVWVAKPASPS